MKDWVIAGVSLLIAVAAFMTRHQWLPSQTVYVDVHNDLARSPAVPSPPPRHLAPAGTFYMVEYVAVRTKHGVAGFQPGLEVQLAAVNKQKGTLTVSDGQYEVEVGPMQITNDLDIAALARRQDQQSQAELQVRQDAERKEYDKEITTRNERYARDVAGVRSGSVIGTLHTLDERATRANYGSSYYYLDR